MDSLGAKLLAMAILVLSSLAMGLLAFLLRGLLGLAGPGGGQTQVLCCAALRYAGQLCWAGPGNLPAAVRGRGRPPRHRPAPPPARGLPSSCLLYFITC